MNTEAPRWTPKDMERFEQLLLAFEQLLLAYVDAVDVLDSIACWGDGDNFAGMDEPGAAQAARNCLKRLRGTPTGRP